MFTGAQLRLARLILDRCRAQGLRLAAAESCTGGLVTGCLSAIPGSSAVLDRGFVTYDNRAKSEMLGVSERLLAEHGAVSEAVACAMAEGALARAPVQLGVAVTGIAGPGGGTATKPVGLVHIAAARTDRRTLHTRHQFRGDRHAIRMAAVEAALELLVEQLTG